MHGLRTVFLAFASLALAGVGCANVSPPDREDQEEDVSEVSQANMVSNDVKLNGIEINGIEINGIEINGIEINGIEINGIEINGTALNGVRSSDGQPLNGTDFVGARLTAVLAGGSSLYLVLNTATWDPTLGMYFYTASYMDKYQTWRDVCGTSGGTPIKSTILPGRWSGTGLHIDDPSMFTLACRGAALAKCAEFGYKWWNPPAHECNGLDCQDIPLATFHQACTRMVRADYCGDGKSHTVNGTPIDIWDNFGIQLRDEAAGMPLEAEWSTRGAVCVKHTRWTNSEVDDPDRDYILSHCGDRWAGPEGDCGDDATSTFVTANGFPFSATSRALLRNESNQGIY